MGTFTAHVLIGRSHPFHGGIQPHSLLSLSENSTPGWFFQRLDPEDPERPARRLLWTPTVERMLEDGLLMAAVHGFAAPAVTDLLPPELAEDSETVRSLYQVKPEAREALYRACRAMLWPGKLVLTVLNGSTIARHIPILSEYRCDIEVCVPAFFREFSQWSNQTVQGGTLGR